MKSQLPKLDEESLFNRIYNPLSFEYLKQLDARYFVKGSQSMETIKRTAKRYLQELLNLIKDAKNFQHLAMERERFESERKLFDEIVSQKRQELVDEYRKTALEKFDKTFLNFPTTYATNSQDDQIVEKSKLGETLRKKGVKEALKDLPALKIWGNPELLNSVLVEVASYFEDLRGNIEKCPPEKIKELLNKFLRENKAFEEIVEEKSAQATEQFKEIRGATVTACTKDISSIDTKYHHKPAKDFDLGKDFKM